MATDRDDDRRKFDEEEERHYWDSLDDQQRAEGEERAAKREAAIEAMAAWFFEQFEDPQNDTPRDSKEQTFIYPWGGPFEAGDVLHGNFGGEYSEEWILAAVAEIESDGTTEWAPNPHGDYYEHPDVSDASSPDVTAALTQAARDRLAELEEIVALLPGVPAALGHNEPPEDIGLPPYSEEDVQEARSAVVQTRKALAEPSPSPAELETFARRFDGWGNKIAHYLGKKADLAVDELVKNSVRVVTWSKAAAAFAAVASTLYALAKHLAG